VGSLYHPNHPPLVVSLDVINFAIYQPYANANQYLHASSVWSDAVPDAMRIITRQGTVITVRISGSNINALRAFMSMKSYGVTKLTLVYVYYALSQTAAAALL